MLFMFKFYYQNGKKPKKLEITSGSQNGTMRGLQIGIGLRDYISGQEGL